MFSYCFFANRKAKGIPMPIAGRAGMAVMIDSKEFRKILPIWGICKGKIKPFHFERVGFQNGKRYGTNYFPILIA
jgi:hypothetical protein